MVSGHLCASESVLGPCTGASYGLEEQIQDNPTSVLLETSWGVMRTGGPCEFRFSRAFYLRMAVWSPYSHLLQFLVLPIHEGFPMLKELALRPLEVLKCPLPLNGPVLHSNDLTRKPQYR